MDQESLKNDLEKELKVESVENFSWGNWEALIEKFKKREMWLLTFSVLATGSNTV